MDLRRVGFLILVPEITVSQERIETVDGRTHEDPLELETSDTKTFYLYYKENKQRLL